MPLAPSDEALIEEELERAISPAEEALFENLWSEHCAYRSSRPLLGAFESGGERVIVGPGDDAAVVSLTDDLYITMGIESHNHPSYVDPYDGAATGVGGIVRDTLSMGAYPIALADCLYFGPFEDDHARYLFEGVVEGIADYGNAIGVPTVAGSVQFHEGYAGNPLVNVACVGLLSADRLVTAAATAPENKLVLIGNATGRDGLGGASFASEDLGEDAATEDRPAVQVGDPYTEKLLIEANEALLDAGIVEAARDLGAAGLGGATSEMVGQGGFGAEIELDAVHQREPHMHALEILLAESQERMCYEVAPGDVEEALAIASRYDLGGSVIGTVTDDGRYRCTFEGEEVVNVPARFLTDGAPLADLPTESTEPPERDVPSVEFAEALDTVIGQPNTASRAWVYRQYDHEVGVRTAIRPGENAAMLAIREADLGLTVSAGADANWTSADPYGGARSVALEVATDTAVMGASPLAAVDCLNGGNPETPRVYDGFAGIVDGLADMCAALEVPVVGGNVSLYNDSPSGPIPPTPTLAMTGIAEEPAAPGRAVTGEGTVALLGPLDDRLGGSQFLASFDGSDRFPALPDSPRTAIETIRAVANAADTLAIHDVSHGGLAVTLSEMVTDDSGISASLDAGIPAALSERVGRAVVETSDVEGLASLVDGRLPVTILGEATSVPQLELATDDGQHTFTAAEIRERRAVIDRQLG